MAQSVMLIKKHEFFELEEIYPGIFTHVREIPKAIGITASEFAAIIGITASSISRNEISKGNKRVTKCIALLTTLVYAVRERDDVSTPEDIQKKIVRWFQTPNRAFSFTAPLELLKARKFEVLQDYAEQLVGVNVP